MDQSTSQQETRKEPRQPCAETSPIAGHHCVVFAADSRLGSGTVLEMALAVHGHLEQHPEDAVFVFDAVSSRPVDLDLSGDAADVSARYAVAEARAREAMAEASEPAEPPTAKPRRGRPKLGVVGREVTLLPRHWEWLERQPGSASVTLRRLVERARREQAGDEARRQAQESAYRFMLTLAGDRPGYEEALRALYARRRDDFMAQIAPWPSDIREHASRLAEPALTGGGTP
ncbi:MAG: DUF2239 family protein [Acidobacteriota bacterium]